VDEGAVDQVGPVLDALELVAGDRQELVDAVDGEVADAAFEVRPRRWWAFTGPCRQPLATAAEGEWWAPAEEVFHLDWRRGGQFGVM
jgi:L-rhamnose mutarotase